RMRHDSRANDADSELRAGIERERSGGVQYWALFDHRNGEFVGCGRLRRWLYTPGEANFEVGFHLVKSCWGKGSQLKQRSARSNTPGKNCGSRKSTLGITLDTQLLSQNAPDDVQE